MAILASTVDNIASGDRILPADGDIVIIKQGVVVAAQGPGAEALAGLLRSNLTVLVDGTLAGEDNGSETGDNATITISETGSVIGTNNGLYVRGANTAINNAGTISSTASQFGAVYIDGPASSVLLTNSGLITSAATAILAEGFGSLINNTGDIVGLVDLSSSIDTFLNSGSVLGDIEFGDGNDLFIGGNGGFVSGIVFGEAGEDTLRGGDGDETLDGGEGNDLIRGGGGADSIFGDLGADELRGGAGDDSVDGGGFADELWGGGGDDTLRGRNGDDTLYGGSGDDFITGDTGSDHLRGGAGEDLLDGGIGRDILWGGADADIFRFRDVPESPDSNPDLIRDFTQGEDVIDLSGLGNNIEFVGTGGFTGGGTASVRYATSEQNSTTTLRIDANGDGSLDMQIDMAGSNFLTEFDFIL